MSRSLKIARMATACSSRRGDDTLALIAGVVEAERRCCRFLRFAIQVEPDDGPIYLDLTGPPGTREFLGNMFAE